MAKLRKLLLIGGLAVVGFFVLLFVIGLAVGGGRTTASATATPVAVAAAAAGATQAPPPTATLAPTVAPTAPPTAVPTVAPTIAPTLAPTVAPTAVPAPPKPAAVPAYDLVSTEQTSLPARPRYKTDVVIPAGYDEAQVIAVLRDAMKKTFEAKRDAKAATVFGYPTRALASTGPASVRALASTDELGWTGDRTFSSFLPGPAPDQGKVYVTLGLGGLGDKKELAVDK